MTISRIITTFAVALAFASGGCVVEEDTEDRDASSDELEIDVSPSDVAEPESMEALEADELVGSEEMEPDPEPWIPGAGGDVRISPPSSGPGKPNPENEGDEEGNGGAHD